jgi:hypothetical protein
MISWPLAGIHSLNSLNRNFPYPVNVWVKNSIFDASGGLDSENLSAG